MIKTEYPRPCPIPGHPQNADEPVLVTESAWARLRAWHLHAPAERLPLPVIVPHLASRLDLARRTRAGPCRHLRRGGRRRGVLADVAPLRAQFPAPAAAPDRGRPGRRGGRRLDGRRCHLGTARLARAPAHLDLPGRRRSAGTAWLRRHEAVRAARQRREDAAAWAARKAGWHRVAHLIGLGDFHLQKVTPTLLGEELLLTSAPGSDLASRIARNADAIAEKYAHLEGLPYGRVDISTTDYPGSAGHRHPPRGPVRQGHRVPPAHHPVAIGGAVPVRRLVPRRGDDPRPGPGRDHPRDRRADDPDPVRRDRRQGHRGARRHRQRQVHPAQRRPGTGHRDGRRGPGAAQRRAHGRRAHLGAAGRGHRLRPGGQRRGGPGQDPRRAGVGAAAGHRAVGHARRRPGTACSSRPRTTRPTS